MFLLAVLSLVGLLTFCAYVVGLVIVLLIVQWALGQFGIAVPQKLFAAIGLLLFLVLLLWFFGGLR